MLDLPDFELLKPQPKVPHVARVVARRDVPNEYGTLVTYTVRQGRNGRDWWIDASQAGMRASNTLHTSNAAKAQQWIRAVETGQICVACSSTPAQLENEIQEMLAKRRTS